MREVNDASNPSNISNSFTPLRLLFAILVLIQHVSVTSGHFFNFSIGIIDCGSLAVFGFFAISGFLITPRILRGNLTGYLLRRSARIFPAFWCLNIVTALIFANIWKGLAPGANYFSISNTASFLMHNVIFLPSEAESPRAGWNLLQGLPIDVPKSGVVNSSLWTLPLEFICYIALGTLIVLLKKYLSRRVGHIFTLLVIIFWFISIYLSSIITNFWVPYPHLLTTLAGKWPYVMSFLIGSLMSYPSSSLMKLKHKLIIVPLLAISFLATFRTTTWAIFGSIAFAAAIIFLGRSNILVKFPLKTDISYGIYLYHFPVIQTLLYFFEGRNDRLLLIILTIFISGVLGYFSAKLVEEPAMKWVKRKYSYK